MIELKIANPVVRRAVIELLASCGPVRIAGEALPAGAAALLVTDQPMTEALPIPVLQLGGTGLALPTRAATLLLQVRQALSQAQLVDAALTERENALLAALVAAAPAALSREALLRQVWEYDPHAETHTIETHIYRLRQKLEARDDSRRIVTVPGGGGYRLEEVIMEGENLAQAGGMT